MSSSTLWVTLAVVVLVDATLIAVLIFRHLKPLARRVLLAMAAVEVLLVVLHLTFRGQAKTFASWFFNLDLEFAGGALFSSAQYTAVALVAALNALRASASRIPQRLYWGAFTLLFAWLALDEFFALHEGILFWRGAYTIGGVAVVGMALLAYWLAFRGHTELSVPLVVGLIMMGTSGVLLDAVTNDHVLVVAGVEMRWLLWFSCDGIIPVPCRYMNELSFSEEFLEMAGVSIVLASLISYTESTHGAEARRGLRWAFAAATSAWLIFFVGYLWIAPTIGSALRARSAQVEYLDSDLALVGYFLSGDVLRPGDELTATLYFRANKPLDEDYRLAVQLIPRYGEEAIAQADFQLGEWQYPSSAWIPGLSVRNRVHLYIPQEVITPQAYWLVARVWHESRAVALASADRQEVGPGSVVVADVVVLSDRAPLPPPIASDYRFEMGIHLVGYALPESAASGGVLPLDFWWETERRVERELNQYVHLFDQVGTFAFGYDQAPFGGESFPTTDWPAKMRERAHWDVPLPADLAPGVYEVYTGLYTLDDVVRLPVADAEGQPIPDFSIHLGAIRITK